MKHQLLVVALLLSACESEDDVDTTGDDANNPTSMTNASSDGGTSDGDSSDSDSDSGSDSDGETSEGGGETSAGGGESSGDASDTAGSADCATFDDMTPYYGDIQVDSFCWTAGLYYACGDPGAGDQTCGVLASFATDGGAACPYC